MAFDANELKELQSSLLPQLHNMADAFSKKAIDTLSQSWPFDHKLRFNRLEPLMKKAYLYKINTQELEKIREYLVENLKKGFIKPLDSLYLLLVLFIKKKDRRLCFYIDYY